MIEAILLVGGQGTRLRPLTATTPKPMLPVAGQPITVHQIRRARAAGVGRVVLGTSYRADVFTRALGDGADLGIDVAYAQRNNTPGYRWGDTKRSRRTSTAVPMIPWWCSTETSLTV